MRTPPLTLFASAARTATPAPSVVDNFPGIGARIIIDVTAITSTPSVVFAVEGYDPASQKWLALLTSAAIVGVGTTILRIFPGATVAANLSANDFMPAMWRVTATHANGNSITYSVGCKPLDASIN